MAVERPWTSGLLPWLAIILCVAIILWKSRTLQGHANDIVSSLINRYLLWRYPVNHVDGNRQIPTCPYRFPNGQGDVGKFLEGIENSEKWERSNGSVYRIWSGMRPEIVLTRPEQLQAVFKDSDKHSKAVNNNSGYLMSKVLGKCVGLISREEWKTVRVSVEQPFLRKSAVGYVPLVTKHVVRHFDELWRDGSLSEGLLDPAEHLKLLPFWVVAEIFYGELSPEMVLELRDLAPLREDLFKDVIRGGLSRFSISQYLPTKANKSLANFQARWKSFNDMAYRRAVSSNLAVPIVHLYELVQRGTITAEHMLQTLDESLYANLDVTTGGISWNLVFLAAHKRYQESLLQESMASPDTHEQYILSSSTLLAACVSESSRLRPLAAFSVPQSAPTERLIDGYIIPPGTDFIVDAYGLNIRNDEFWGVDAALYRPERFLERGALEMRYHFWRFGFGPRQCMGKYVADTIIRTLIHHLVNNYDLDLLPSSSGWGRDPESWINHPKMNIRCVRKQPS